MGLCLTRQINANLHIIIVMRYYEIPYDNSWKIESIQPNNIYESSKPPN